MMFRTREDFRFYVPRELLNGEDGVVHYRMFERLLNIPLFMVSVFAMEDGEKFGERWQTFFLQDVPEVTQLVAMEFWSAHKVYVILPEHVTGKDRQIMASCSAIWQCSHDDYGGAVWLFETDQGRFRHGADEPVLQEDCEKTLVWSQSLPAAVDSTICAPTDLRN